MFSSRDRILRRQSQLKTFALTVGFAAISSLLAIAQSSSPAKSAAPVANFVDVAGKSGLTMLNVFGGRDTKKYILETTGTGVAIFDYDNDGWPDIFVVNGTMLEGLPSGEPPTN